MSDPIFDLQSKAEKGLWFKMFAGLLIIGSIVMLVIYLTLDENLYGWLVIGLAFGAGVCGYIGAYLSEPLLEYERTELIRTDRNPYR